MDSVELHLTTGRRRVVDVTAEVQAYVRAKGDGLCHVFVPHATAGVALIEVGAGSEPDLAAALDRLFPRDEPYRHRHGSPGHGADHVVPAFVCPSLVLAVRDGRAVLGTWQSVVLVDPNPDNPERRLVLSFLPG